MHKMSELIHLKAIYPANRIAEFMGKGLQTNARKYDLWRKFTFFATNSKITSLAKSNK